MASARPAVALNGLPPQPPLVGRDQELDRLAEFLDPRRTAPPGGAVVVSAVSGLAGVGKTALAVAMAHRAVDAGWFPGGTIFLDLLGYDEPDRRISSWQALGIALGVLGVAGPLLPTTEAERAAMYRSILVERAQQDMPILVVADNASSADQVRSLIPGINVHRILITSRHTLADIDGVRLFDLEILSPADGVALMSQVLRTARPGDSRIDDDNASAARLGELCGYLPLALRIISARLATDPESTAAELADLLSDAKNRLRSLTYGDSLGVRAAFDLSYQHLPQEQARAFRLLSVNPSTRISTAATAAVIGLPSAETRRILAELRRANLLQSGMSAGQWKLHDLMYLYASGRMEEEDGGIPESAAVRLLNHYVTVTRAAADHLDRSVVPDDRSQIFGSRDAALDWLDQEHTTLVAVIKLAARLGLPGHCVSLTLTLHYHFLITQDWVENIDLHETALNSARSVSDRLSEARLLSNQGMTQGAAIRRVESLKTLHQARAIFRELNERVYEGQVLSKLGGTLRDMRRLDESIRCLEESASIADEQGDLLGFAEALTHLAGVYRQVRRLDDSIRSHQRAMDIYQPIDGHDGYARNLQELGIAYRERGQLEQAVVCHEQALAVFQKNRDRGREGFVHEALGLAYLRLGRTAESIDSIKAALRIFEDLRSPHRCGQIMRNLGEAYCHAGQHTEAFAALEKSLQLSLDIKDQWCEARALASPGNAHVLTGEPGLAIPRYEAALALFRELGDRNWEGDTLEKLGSATRLVLDYSGAVQWYSLALEICRDLKDRRGEGRVLIELGSVLHGSGQTAAARRMWLDAVDVLAPTDETALTDRARSLLDS